MGPEEAGTTMQALKVVPREAPGGVAQLFAEHGRTVYRAAYRITGSEADAEDVLQTVFLRLVRQHDLPSMDPGKYLRRAGVNAALDVLRQRRTSRTVPLELVEDALPSTEARHDAGELRRRLRDALSRLHPRTAETFALRFIEGWDNREIARTLGTSAAVVAVTLHRARALLKRDLGRENAGRQASK
jgi:RNA polymerase sigma factor (sigma-70 family)